MCKVSVIIPVYGVEKYIERCVRSLFEQTLEDMEFIFVDDCSPDSSVCIIMRVSSEYPKRRKQVKIVRHNENQGLAQARQSGLRIASGEYIAHCDSDDWVDIDLYEKLYYQAIEQAVDVIVFDGKVTDGSRTLQILSGGNFTNVGEYIVSMMHRKIWWSLCNKLIKRELYDHKDILYPKDGIGEDMCLTLQLMYYCNSITYNPNVFYYYYNNSSSMIHVQTVEKCLSKFEQISRNVGYVKKFYSDKPQIQGIKKGLRYLEYNSKFTLLPALGIKEHYQLWRKSYKGCEWAVVCDQYADTKERIRALLCILKLYPLPRTKFWKRQIE